MSLTTTRRLFLTGLAAVVAAPAIVRATSLMPVKAWSVPSVLTPRYMRVVWSGAGDGPWLATVQGSADLKRWADIDAPHVNIFGPGMVHVAMP